MERDEGPGRARRVPGTRLARLGRMGGAVSHIAANAAFNGAQRLARGERPPLRDLLLTPANVSRFAEELARMRGAAMKMGQLISMDAGDMLPPELAEIMARLRAEADHMPPKQLRAVLDQAWGEGWIRRFRRFEGRPIAAASIGQVHRAETRDGRSLAIKIQYPGVRRSIDSDVANVGTLLRLSGMLPDGVDIAPFLEEAKRQLHEEADYEREAAQLAAFAAHLSEDPDFTVPTPATEFTTRDVLAMSFVKGIPVERMAEAPQAERDRIVRLLLSLMLRELFDFGLVQTDPNFANYRYDPETRRIVLLDFGAARAYAPALAKRYRRCLSLGVTGEREGQREAAILAGFISAETAAHHQDAVLDLMAIAAAPFRSAAPTDFGTDRTASQLRDQGYDLAMDRAFADIVPMGTLYLQRKVAGMYLLARRLRARVDLAALIAPYLEGAANEKRASLG